jgi:hypothetical protein
MVNSWIESKMEAPAGDLTAAIHRPSGDTVARPGTDEITRYATGRAEPVGEAVTATVDAGVTLGATDVFGAVVPGVGAATHADTLSDITSARACLFTSG